jgi:hypothetical protein
MSTKNVRQNIAAAGTRISANEFGALREFLRGYFHEDMTDDYGSPAGAARQFCRDASAEQRHAVATEWERLLLRTRGQSLDVINSLLTEELGSARTLSQTDLKRISGVFLRESDD